MSEFNYHDAPCMDIPPHPVASAINDMGSRLRITDPDGQVYYSSLTYTGGNVARYVVFERFWGHDPSKYRWVMSRRKDWRAVLNGSRYSRMNGRDVVVVRVEEEPTPNHGAVLEILEKAMDHIRREHPDERVVVALAEVIAEVADLAARESADKN